MTRAAKPCAGVPPAALFQNNPSAESKDGFAHAVMVHIKFKISLKQFLGQE